MADATVQMPADPQMVMSMAQVCVWVAGAITTVLMALNQGFKLASHFGTTRYATAEYVDQKCAALTAEIKAVEISAANDSKLMQKQMIDLRLVSIAVALKLKIDLGALGVTP